MAQQTRKTATKATAGKAGGKQQTTKARSAVAKVRSAATVNADHVRGHAGGFVDFIRKQGVIGLAVGLAIGTAAGDTVKRIVEGFINPVVQFIVGTGNSLATATWHVELFGRKADFAWGAALSSTITLLATALVIYWLVNIFKLDRLDKKKED